MQYQSLLFSKYEQISANVVFATLLLYFGYPRKSIFSSSDRDYKIQADEFESCSPVQVNWIASFQFITQKNFSHYKGDNR